MTVLRVLVVDEDTSFVRETCQLLLARRYAAVSAADFDEAARWISHYRGRLAVVAGLGVNGRSGIAFLEGTRRKHPHVPFTFVAEAPPLESVIEALKQGAYDFLRKPVPPDILLHSVARSLEKLNLSLETEKRERETRNLLAESDARLKDLERASSFRSFLLSMVAHDFRSVVTVLDGYLQAFAERCGDCGSDAAGLVAQARRTTARLRRMAATILDHEAAERGALRIEARPFELEALLEECVSFYGPYAAQKGVELAVEEPLPAIVARADPDRVLQVLDNIVYNAVKFTPPEGSIRIGARLDGGRAIVWVRDTGLGIDGRVIEAACLPGNPEGLNDAGARIGLGLAICRRLVESQRGTLTIESERGKGTVVSFTLPV